MLWTEKYRPKLLEDIIGNEEAKVELLKWILNWEKNKKSAPGVLLTGPPGIGKTTAIHALANEFNFHLIELNASDFRTAQKIYNKVGYVTHTVTLDSFSKDKAVSKRVILFFDEIDGIDPKSDTGGLKAVIDIASKRQIPIFAAANVPDPVAHKELLKTFKIIEFKNLTPRQIILLLKRIVLLENSSVDDEILKKIAYNARGDARLAVNMLQEAVAGVELEYLSPPMENLPLDVLMKRLNSSNSLTEIKNLLNSNSNQIEDVFYNYFDMILKSGNIKPVDKVRLLEECSKIDILFGLINKKRNFRMLRYITILLPWLIYSANRSGVVYDGRIPEYRLRLFIFNRNKRQELSSLYETYFKGRIHSSYRKFILYTFPLVCFYIDEKEYSSLNKYCKSKMKIVS